MVVLTSALSAIAFYIAVTVGTKKAVPWRAVGIYWTGVAVYWLLRSLGVG